MRRAAIVNPVRTPVGAFGGALRPVPVETLGGIVAKETLKRSGLDPKLVEDVVFAQSYANSETPCVGRWIALDAGGGKVYFRSAHGTSLSQTDAGVLQQSPNSSAWEQFQPTEKAAPPAPAPAQADGGCCTIL